MTERSTVLLLGFPDLVPSFPYIGKAVRIVRVDGYKQIVDATLLHFLLACFHHPILKVMPPV